VHFAVCSGTPAGLAAAFAAPTADQNAAETRRVLHRRTPTAHTTPSVRSGQECVAPAPSSTPQTNVTMGLLDGMLGNASKIDPARIQAEFQQILAPGERVEHAYQLIRDHFVFTDKRFIMVDRQGLTGSKVEYHSIPYRSILHFCIETGGTFDLDAELKIWISGSAVPIQKQFNKKLSIYEVQAVLASYVLR
jgi:hypothetical protein